MEEIEQAEWYFGQYPGKFDKSYRVLVPKEWRPRRGPCEFMVIPWPFEAEQPACLAVWPLALYRTTISKTLKRKPVLDDKFNSFKRVIGSSSKPVEFDDFGRIALSENLVQQAGIAEGCELVGAVDHFELWNRERFRAALAADKKVAAELKPALSEAEAQAGPVAGAEPLPAVPDQPHTSP